jgi:hypothetical protein
VGGYEGCDWLGFVGSSRGGGCVEQRERMRYLDVEVGLEFGGYREGTVVGDGGGGGRGQ